MNTQEELARLLPAPKCPDLSADRHQELKKLVMSSLPETAPSRRRLIRMATPLVLAAAAAGAAFVIPAMSSSPAVPTATPTSSTPIAAATSLSGYIKTSSYVLQREPDDMIKVTVRVTGGKPDSTGLKRDLARMGVKVQVYEDVPTCTPLVTNLAQRNEDGDFVATIPVKILTDYPETIIFADDPSDPDAVILSIGAGSGPEPTCGPVPPLPADHTPVAETTVE